MATKSDVKAAVADAGTRKAAANVDSDLDELRGDLNALRSDLAKLLSDTGTLASAKSKQGLDRGRELTENARKEIDTARHSLEDKVRENPLTAVGIALGAGALISFLSARR
jgi:ElaB/YqjD/DUF883 family membrane-anchored ribosome-binding protein